MKITYAKSIYSLKENADFTIYNDDIDNIIWHDNNPINITYTHLYNNPNLYNNADNNNDDDDDLYDLYDHDDDGEMLTDDQYNYMIEYFGNFQ